MGVREIAAAVRSVFRAQREQAHGGKERFHDWDKRLADALVAAKLPARRAALAADSINGTTNGWLQDGRDPAVVFSAARVAQIAVTEYLNAKHDEMIEKHRGKRVRWKLGGAACPDCKSLAGKTVVAGKQQFVAKSGAAVYAPTLHPNCRCTLEVV